jgi:leucyl aminopeptidase
MSIAFTLRAGDPARLATPLLAVALPSDKPLPRPLAALDKSLGGALARAIKQRDFKGSRDETFVILNANRGPQRVMLVGLGANADAAAMTRAASIAGRKANAMGVQRMGFWAADLALTTLENAAIGLSLGSWEYTDLKTMPPVRERPKPLVAATICVASARGAQAALAAGVAVAEGHRVARRLAIMPGNICTPAHIASTAKDIAKRHKLKVTVMGRREMTRLKMGSFLAVAQGTPQAPKFIILEYKGGKRGEAPIALVGKGLCFDSGGISIKPAAGMEWMKFDMSGAAGVLGAMEAIARLKLKVNVVALIGSTTNMPSGTAMNPGDVVHAMNGKSIEIVNTDAEGRLVLADVLAYAMRYKPQAMLDAATLTGACVIALGNIATGVLGNDQGVVDEVIAAGKRGGEPGWQLPLWNEYRDLIKSDVADIKNIGGRGAGTITAALFLAEFTQGCTWAHLDVAGTAYSETDLGMIGRGPTGTPVRTFFEFVRGRAR